MDKTEPRSLGSRPRDWKEPRSLQCKGVLSIDWMQPRPRRVTLEAVKDYQSERCTSSAVNHQLDMGAKSRRGCGRTTLERVYPGAQAALRHVPYSVTGRALLLLARLDVSGKRLKCFGGPDQVAFDPRFREVHRDTERRRGGEIGEVHCLACQIP